MASPCWQVFFMYNNPINEVEQVGSSSTQERPFENPPPPSFAVMQEVRPQQLLIKYPADVALVKHSFQSCQAAMKNIGSAQATTIDHFSMNGNVRVAY